MKLGNLASIFDQITANVTVLTSRAVNLMIYGEFYIYCFVPDTPLIFLLQFAMAGLSSRMKDMKVSQIDPVSWSYIFVFNIF